MFKFHIEQNEMYMYHKISKLEHTGGVFFSEHFKTPKQRLVPAATLKAVIHPSETYHP
jgi:hypothetical protein